MDCTNSDKTTQSNQYYYNSPPAAQTNAQDYYNQNQPLVPQFHSHPPEQSLQNPPESHSVSIIDKKEEGIPPPPSTTSLDTTGLIQRTYVPPAPAEEALRKLPNQYRDESIIPVSLQKYISPKQEGFLERFCCYCCPRKRKHRLICCGFITVVVIVMAVLIGVYIPRFPEIKVYSVNLQNLANMNTPYSFTYKNPAKPNLNELILQMNLSMEVGTYNSNLYGLNVDEINLVANLMVNESYVYNPLRTNSLTSYGSLVKVVGLPSKPADPSYYPSNTSQVGIAQRGSIYFPSKQWVNYTMMFQFSYTPDPVVGLLKDPTILDLADVCGITSKYTPRRPMRIHYDAKSTIAILKPLGYA
ncbi:hypothetical protein BDR26DRAFT_858388 [Obelidium mucronatum]|nr:hypothetical protein BDR26DRAFT_858388 [Obelidium mucronatum]